MKIANGLLTLLILFLYGTGQSICTCDSNDACAGITNILHQYLDVPTTITDQFNSNINSYPDCCDDCLNPENIIGSISPEDPDTVELETASLWSNGADLNKRSNLLSSLPEGRAPPGSGLSTSLPVYLQKRTLLI